MNRRARHPHRPHVPLTKCRFNLEDEAERRALDWIQGFHDPSGIRRLLDIRRGHSAEGKRMIWMLTRSCAARPGARPRWLVLEYMIDEIHVTLPSYSTLRAGRAAFETAAPASALELTKEPNPLGAGRLSPRHPTEPSQEQQAAPAR